MSESTDTIKKPRYQRNWTDYIAGVGVGIVLGVILLQQFDYSTNAKSYVPFIGVTLLLISLFLTLKNGRR